MAGSELAPMLCDSALMERITKTDSRPSPAPNRTKAPLSMAILPRSVILISHRRLGVKIHNQGRAVAFGRDGFGQAMYQNQSAMGRLHLFRRDIGMGGEIEV